MRAWVSVVLVGYALAFLALLIALSARSDRDEGPGEAIGIVLRVIAEALFWTFHPFSPVYLRARARLAARPAAAQRQPKIPFYEKVNRFVFGPPKAGARPARGGAQGPRRAAPARRAASPPPTSCA